MRGRYISRVNLAIREYTKRDVAKIRRLYNILNYDNILIARECFVNKGCIYALVNDLQLTLEQLIGCRSLYPTFWMSLIYRNILLGLDSVIKIASLEIYVERPPDTFRFLSALSIVKSIKSLKEQPLIRKESRLVGELILLTRSILVSIRIFYSYKR
ncbi:hypothetical protein N7516_004742 [Penicillium verrucosum]|uniref:uncharacterized protein n=1 Tax=Penicillium verrucosum TaxID=60171 RepID=UPI0025453543|nr:uncharacterized protein N7516_004742 [Penicillium verrucosum]KAJ5944574.1 hypothetical protein N7516_004742 [Penicillium verrucosum]